MCCPAMMTKPQLSDGETLETDAGCERRQAREAAQAEIEQAIHEMPGWIDGEIDLDDGILTIRSERAVGSGLDVLALAYADDLETAARELRRRAYLNQGKRFGEVAQPK